MSLLQKSQTQVPYGCGEVILLVEDDQNVQSVLKMLLEHLGYQVLLADHGRAAVEIFGRYQDKIALVLSDVRMPEMDGVTLTQILHKQNPAIKVVLMTGYPLDLER